MNVNVKKFIQALVNGGSNYDVNNINFNNNFNKNFNFINELICLFYKYEINSNVRNLDNCNEFINKSSCLNNYNNYLRSSENSKNDNNQPTNKYARPSEKPSSSKKQSLSKQTPTTPSNPSFDFIRATEEEIKKFYERKALDQDYIIQGLQGKITKYTPRDAHAKKDEKLEITFFHDGKWMTITALRHDILRVGKSRMSPIANFVGIRILFDIVKRKGKSTLSATNIRHANNSLFETNKATKRFFDKVLPPFKLGYNKSMAFITDFFRSDLQQHYSENSLTRKPDSRQTDDAIESYLEAFHLVPDQTPTLNTLRNLENAHTDLDNPPEHDSPGPDHPSDTECNASTYSSLMDVRSTEDENPPPLRPKPKHRQEKPRRQLKEIDSIQTQLGDMRSIFMTIQENLLAMQDNLLRVNQKITFLENHKHNPNPASLSESSHITNPNKNKNKTTLGTTESSCEYSQDIECNSVTHTADLATTTTLAHSTPSSSKKKKTHSCEESQKTPQQVEIEDFIQNNIPELPITPQQNKTAPKKKSKNKANKA